MKYIISLCVCVCIFFLSSSAQDNKPVGIGVKNPDTRALLHLESKDKALYLPRLTTAERNAQTGWKAGMVIYNTTENCIQQFDGTTWKCLGDMSAAQLDTLGWKVRGNAGTDTAINFVGTTDNRSLMFRINNINAGRLTYSNTALGYRALNPASTGSSNTALGDSALASVTSGSRNTAVGFGTLASNTGGGLSGSWNTAVGYYALRNNTSGWQNTALGHLAMAANTTGMGNIAIGHSALGANTTGGLNMAIGTGTLVANISGSENTGIGINALASNTTGSNNVAVGRDALRESTTGSHNVALGYKAGLGGNTTGSRNILIGSGTQVINTSSPSASNEMNIGNTLFGTNVDSTVGVGYIGINTNAPAAELDVNGQARVRALPNGAATDSMVTADVNGNLRKKAPGDLVTPYAWSLKGNAGTNPAMNFVGTTDGAALIFKVSSIAGGIWGSNTSLGVLSLDVTRSWSASAIDNVAIGTRVLQNLTYGFKNTAIGNYALSNGAAGLENTAVGYSSMKSYNSNNPDMGNTAVGAFSLMASVGGLYNTAIGNSALQSNLASQNTAVGSRALISSVNGVRNTAIGFWAMQQNVSGMDNIAIGGLSGQANITTGNSNIVIGTYADVSAPGVSNELNIGNLIVANSTGQVGIGTISTTWPPTAKLDVNGNARVRTLASGTAADSIVTADVNGNLRRRTVKDAMANNWQLGGNTGTSSAVNYLGTADNASLRIRTNNAEHIVVDSLGRVGVGVTNPKTALHIRDSASVLFGNDTLGYGNKMYWNAAKGAFRAGGLTSAPSPDGSLLWDTDSIGSYSIAMGRNVSARGVFSIAMGHGTRAWGNGGFAVGYTDTAAGNYSAAIGQNNFAGGNASLAAGTGNRVLANYGVALGQNNTATGAVGFAAGFSNTAAQNSAAIGFGNRSDGNAVVSLGYTNINGGAQGATIIGKSDTIIAGTESAIAIGNGLRMEGKYAVGIGFTQAAKGEAGISIGSHISNTHKGALTLADYSYYDVTPNKIISSAADHGFTSVFKGGYRFFTDRNNQVDKGMFMYDAASGAKVGINSPAPAANLEVKGNMLVDNGTTNGGVQIKDGTQGLGRVLTSDANGLATWQDIPGTPGGFVLSTVTLASGSRTYSSASPVKYLGRQITLTPGRWLIYYGELVQNNAMPANSSVWIQLSLSESQTSDLRINFSFQGSSLVSGGLSALDLYSLLSGVLVVQVTNTTTVYTILKGGASIGSGTLNNAIFDTGFGENYLFATKMY